MLFSSDKVLFTEPEAPGSIRKTPGREGKVCECPRCDSRSVARSPIRGMFGELAKRVLGLRPYQCLDCWHRFVAMNRRV